MFESQGTTPAEQDSTAQLVNAVETRQATLEEQAKQIIELEAKLALSTETVETWRSNYFEALDTIQKARRLIEESLSEAEEPMVLYAEFRDAFEVLDVKAEEEVELEITVTFIATVTKPMGYEIDPENDFSASLDLENSELTMDVRWSPDISVSDRY